MEALINKVALLTNRIAELQKTLVLKLSNDTMLPFSTPLFLC